MNYTLSVAETLIDIHSDPSALTRIYDDNVNLAIWNRRLEDEVTRFSKILSAEFNRFQLRCSGHLPSIEKQLDSRLPNIIGKKDFVEDVVLLSDMFSELLDIKEMGVRLAVLTKAMCPKFHVDRVPARLVTTYWGAGTEWMDNFYTRRNEEGRVVVLESAPINQLCTGQVGLMKGEMWEGNEGRGLVHRSPSATEFEPRLVLTLDCMA